MVWCKAPSLLASLASLRKYSSFVITNAIDEENPEKTKQSKEKKYKEKGSRREEIIELLWHMAKFKSKCIRRLVPEYFKPEYRILLDTFQGL